MAKKDKDMMDSSPKVKISRGERIFGVFNVIILGVAARSMDFSKEQWLKVIADTVPQKTIEINQKAFIAGFEG